MSAYDIYAVSKKPQKPGNQPPRTYFSRPTRALSVSVEPSITMSPASKKMHLHNNDMLPVLREHYNADPNDPVFGTDKAVYMRESLRFSEKVRAELNKIWEWTDDDKSGTVDLEEYTRMFRAMYPVLYGVTGTYS